MKIAVLYPDDFSIWHFRKGMIKALIANGHEVYIICPYGDYVSRLESLGVIHISIECYRFISPLKDLKYFISLYTNIVGQKTVKPGTFQKNVDNNLGITGLLMPAVLVGVVMQQLHWVVLCYAVFYVLAFIVVVTRLVINVERLQRVL